MALCKANFANKGSKIANRISLKTINVIIKKRGAIVNVQLGNKVVAPEKAHTIPEIVIQQVLA